LDDGFVYPESGSTNLTDVNSYLGVKPSSNGVYII
jgi:hypothetical protein